MKAFAFAPPAFGPRLGSPIPLRRSSLGFTPTGAAMPTECSDIGVRMIEDQGGYTPIGCPVGPDCYDIIDAVTGQIVVAKAKGTTPWVDLCTQFGYQKPAGASTPTPPPPLPGGGTANCPTLSPEEYQTRYKAEEAAWTSEGRNTLRGICAILTYPEGNRYQQQCFFPDHGSGGVDAPVAEGASTPSCQAQWDRLCSQHAPDKCGITQSPPAWSSPAAAAPAPAPTPTAPPVTAPSGEGPVPLSIDIQAFTPGGTGPIPAQPLMQPAPIMQPRPAQQVVKTAPTTPAPTLAPAPKEPESKPLETGSVIGIGLVALTAIAAAIFGGGK